MIVRNQRYAIINNFSALDLLVARGIQENMGLNYNTSPEVYSADRASKAVIAEALFCRFGKGYGINCDTATVQDMAVDFLHEDTKLLRPSVTPDERQPFIQASIAHADSLISQLQGEKRILAQKTVSFPEFITHLQQKVSEQLRNNPDYNNERLAEQNDALRLGIQQLAIRLLADDMSRRILKLEPGDQFVQLGDGHMRDTLKRIADKDNDEVVMPQVLEVISAVREEIESRGQGIKYDTATKRTAMVL